MNELGFEALVMLSLIHGTKAETLVYTDGFGRAVRNPDFFLFTVCSV